MVTSFTVLRNENVALGKTKIREAGKYSHRTQLRLYNELPGLARVFNKLDMCHLNAMCG